MRHGIEAEAGSNGRSWNRNKSKRNQIAMELNVFHFNSIVLSYGAHKSKRKFRFGFDLAQYFPHKAKLHSFFVIWLFLGEMVNTTHRKKNAQKTMKVCNETCIETKELKIKMFKSFFCPSIFNRKRLAWVASNALCTGSVLSVLLYLTEYLHFYH